MLTIPAGGASAATPADAGQCPVLLDNVVKDDGSVLAAGTGGDCGQGGGFLIQFTREGAVDAAFADGGLKKLDYGPGGMVELMRTEDRSAVLVTGAGLRKYRNDGSPDPSFGDGGEIKDVPAELLGGANIQSAAVSTDGRILIAGGSSAQPGGISIVRFEADGDLDPSFGGDGIVKPVIPEPDIEIATMTVRVDGEGRVIVAGMGQGLEAPAVFRFLEDGSPDPDFGQGDGFSAPWTGGSLRPQARIVDVVAGPDGEVRTYFSYLGISMRSSTLSERAVLDASGAPDGPILRAPVRFFTETPDGGMIGALGSFDPFGGPYFEKFGLTKTRPTGQADESFDSTPLPVSPPISTPTAATYDGAGSLIVSGYTQVTACESKLSKSCATRGNMVVAKVDAVTGKPDADFGTGGIALAPENECELGVAPSFPGRPATPWKRCRMGPVWLGPKRISILRGATRKPVVTGRVKLGRPAWLPTLSKLRLSIRLPQRLRPTGRAQGKLAVNPMVEGQSFEGDRIVSRLKGRTIVVELTHDPADFYADIGFPTSGLAVDFRLKRGAVKPFPRRQLRRRLNFRAKATIIPIDPKTGEPNIYYGEDSTSRVLKVRPTGGRTR